MSYPNKTQDVAPLPAKHVLWRIVLENTIVGIAYMRHRRFVWVNRRMEQIFGYAPGELDGVPVRILYQTSDDYAAVGRMIEVNFNKHEFYTHERAQIRKSGEVIWCRISGRLIEPGNRQSSSVWVVQEITDKKRAEDQIIKINQELEETIAKRTLNLSRTNAALSKEIEHRRRTQSDLLESREKYRTLFRNVPLGLLVTDPNGVIMEANKTLRDYLGVNEYVTLKSILEKPDCVQMPDGRNMSIASLISEARSSSKLRYGLEFTWHGRDTTAREINMTTTILAHGLGTVCVFTDITEQRRRSEKELAQQAALAHAARLSLIGQMTSALAHELGQPLNAAQSYLAGVSHRLGANASPELMQALDKATMLLEQAGSIIRNVRGFVSRQHHRPIEPVDLGTLLSQTLALLEHPLRAGSTRVSFQVDSNIEAVYGRPVELQQVLVNLIMNAIEAMEDLPPSERIIKISVAQVTSSHVSIAIADHGPGIPPELAPKLFDPYVTTKKNGLGMGLMICRTIIESHGGALHLQNSDRGTTMCFTIPLAP